MDILIRYILALTSTVNISAPEKLQQVVPFLDWACGMPFCRATDPREKITFTFTFKPEGGVKRQANPACKRDSDQCKKVWVDTEAAIRDRFGEPTQRIGDCARIYSVGEQRIVFWDHELLEIAATEAEADGLWTAGLDRHLCESGRKFRKE